MSKSTCPWNIFCYKREWKIICLQKFLPDKIPASGLPHFKVNNVQRKFRIYGLSQNSLRSRYWSIALVPQSFWCQLFSMVKTPTQPQLNYTKHNKTNTEYSMTATPPLSLIRFWTNFKSSFHGSTFTIDIFQSNIWPDNICPGAIFPTSLYTEFIVMTWTKIFNRSQLPKWHWSAC